MAIEKKRTTVLVDAFCYGITYFRLDDNGASGVIFGRNISVDADAIAKIPKNAKQTPESAAKHALFNEYVRLYGDPVYTPHKNPVKNTRVKNAGNGVSIATAEIDGNVVQETFIGSVSDSDGNVMEAKPWLGDVRRRLVDKTEGKAPEKLFTRTSDLVDILFIKKLVEAKLNVDAPNQVVRIGNEIIRLSGLTQVEATLEIKAAIDRFKAERAENTKLVEDFFKEIAA